MSSNPPDSSNSQPEVTEAKSDEIIRKLLKKLKKEREDNVALNAENDMLKSANAARNMEVSSLKNELRSVGSQLETVHKAYLQSSSFIQAHHSCDQEKNALSEQIHDLQAAMIYKDRDRKMLNEEITVLKNQLVHLNEIINFHQKSLKHLLNQNQNQTTIDNFNLNLNSIENVNGTSKEALLPNLPTLPNTNNNPTATPNPPDPNPLANNTKETPSNPSTASTDTNTSNTNATVPNVSTTKNDDDKPENNENKNKPVEDLNTVNDSEDKKEDNVVPSNADINSIISNECSNISVSRSCPWCGQSVLIFGGAFSSGGAQAGSGLGQVTGSDFVLLKGEDLNDSKDKDQTEDIQKVKDDKVPEAETKVVTTLTNTTNNETTSLSYLNSNLMALSARLSSAVAVGVTLPFRMFKYNYTANPAEGDNKSNTLVTTETELKVMNQGIEVDDSSSPSEPVNEVDNKNNKKNSIINKTTTLDTNFPAINPYVPLVIECVWENERFIPLVGWSPSAWPLRPNFSDETGAVIKAPLSYYVLEPGWSWQGQWCVVTPTPSTDEYYQHHENTVTLNHTSTGNYTKTEVNNSTNNENNNGKDRSEDESSAITEKAIQELSIGTPSYSSLNNSNNNKKPSETQASPLHLPLPESPLIPGPGQGSGSVNDPSGLSLNNSDSSLDVSPHAIGLHLSLSDNLGDGWQYATLNSSWHITCRSTDTFRRRRWIRVRVREEHARAVALKEKIVSAGLQSSSTNNHSHNNKDVNTQENLATIRALVDDVITAVITNQDHHYNHHDDQDDQESEREISLP